MEDYVSFNIARLLKEKGFDWECIGYYVDYEPNIVHYSFCGETNSTWESRCCSAPTHQVAMKWLREEHHIHIGINPTSRKGYYATIYDVADFDDYGIFSRTECFFHAEEAVEAAIKYCLENEI